LQEYKANATLSTTTVSKIASLPNSTNAALMTEFYHVRKDTIA
jgi:hypothetical protein